MARNRSEKLMRCPEAHVYADAAEAWLNEDQPLTLPFDYWTNIALSIRDRINRDLAATSKGKGLRYGRKRRIAYIRRMYAP